MKQGQTYEKCRRCGKNIKKSGAIFGWCEDCLFDKRNVFISEPDKQDETIVPIEGIEIQITNTKADGNKAVTEIEQIKLNDRASRSVEKIINKVCSIQTDEIIKEFIKFLKTIEKEIKS